MYHRPLYARMMAGVMLHLTAALALATPSSVVLPNLLPVVPRRRFRGVAGRRGYGKTGKRHRPYGIRERGRYAGWPDGPLHNREAVTHAVRP